MLAINKGWSDVRRCPRLVFDTLEAEDLKTYADSLPKLVGVGMRIPVQWAHERLRIPQPGDDEAVLATEGKVKPEPTDKGKAAARAALSAALKSGKNADVVAFADQDAIDGALADLDAALQPQVEAWLKPALDALAKASTADAALELLASENPMVADSVLIEAVARAMFVAELVGADSAQQELGE
jgi:phage gp29-like protein